MMAATTAPAGCQPRRRNRNTKASAPGRKWANTTASKSCIDGSGTSQPKSSMVGVNSSDCGSAAEGWPPKW